MKNFLSQFFSEIGGIFIFFGEVVKTLVRGPKEWGEILIQMYRVGVQSLAVVFMAGFFVGAIVCIQFNYPLEMLGAQFYLGGITTSAIFREVGPMLIAAMISGRIGAFIAAELGTMKVTEQVDAIRCLGVDPMTFLVAPRFVAVSFMVLVLTVLGLMIASCGAAFIANVLLHLNLKYYIVSTIKLADITAFSYAIVKGFVFGLVVATVACKKGMAAEGGAEGVGITVRSSLVITAIGLFTVEYILTSLLNVVVRFVEMEKALYM